MVVSASMAASFVDWRGRPCGRGKHGGMRAAIFVMGIQAMEIMAIAAVGNNLITYVIGEMHYSLPKSANMVTNFVGTIFLLSILGGYLSDSYFGCFLTMLVFGVIELIGYLLMAVQAHVSELKPRPCNMQTPQVSHCETPKGIQTFILYFSLYLVALGSGCMKPNMVSHGANQFNFGDPTDNRMSTYFNFAYLSFCIGELLSLTLLIWVQTHAGVDIGFAISAAIMFLGLLSLIIGMPFYRNRPPLGSVLTRVLQVLFASFRNRKFPVPDDSVILFELKDAEYNKESQAVIPHTKQFRCLDRAAIIAEADMMMDDRKANPWKLCRVTQIEEVKILIRVMPIFGCTIIVNCILAQLQTFSVQQGSAMNRQVCGFEIPPASMQAIPYMILVFLVPLYDAVIVPMLRRVSGIQTGITHLQRIGIGLLLSGLSMVTAAMVETKRKAYASDDGKLSIMWLAPQFVVFGLCEMFTAVALIEFFYRQSPPGMQAMLTALTYCSYSLGFFLSSVLVSVVNKASTLFGSGHAGWLASNDLNEDHLERFYWLLAILSFVNLLHYAFWSAWFNRSTSSPSSSSSSSRVISAATAASPLPS